MFDYVLLNSLAVTHGRDRSYRGGSKVHGRGEEAKTGERQSREKLHCDKKSITIDGNRCQSITIDTNR